MNRQRLLQISVLLIALLFGAPGVAWAWFDAGHMLIAEIAYRKLQESPESWKQIVELLKAHPRLADLKQGMPEGLAENEQWHFIFLKAATWPDMVRAKPTMDADAKKISQQYHHGPHHYINYPLNTEEVKGAEPEEKWKPGTDPQNIVQALEMNAQGLRDAKKSAEDRAVCLAWILHLVGDVHQPLHTIALFSKAFPEGDRGGNLFQLKIEKGEKLGNLHLFWDSLLGEDDRANLKSIVESADALLKQFPPETLKDELGQSGYAAWAKAGFELAKKVAYLDGKLAPHQALSDDYKKAAHDAANRQAALAGYRLANTLIEALKPAKK